MPEEHPGVVAVAAHRLRGQTTLTDGNARYSSSKTVTGAVAVVETALPVLMISSWSGPTTHTRRPPITTSRPPDYADQHDPDAAPTSADTPDAA